MVFSLLMLATPMIGPPMICGDPEELAPGLSPLFPGAPGVPFVVPSGETCGCDCEVSVPLELNVVGLCPEDEVEVAPNELELEPNVLLLPNVEDCPNALELVFCPMDETGVAPGIWPPPMLNAICTSPKCSNLKSAHFPFLQFSGSL